MQRSHNATETVLPPTGSRLPQPVAAGNFVINLCSSTTPVALAQLNHAELKKFTFFVSRRREDRRERFRLHMGYFSTQEDAEKLLELVREIYPAAWAGVAPGQKLRAAAAAHSAALPPLSPAEIEIPPVVKTDAAPPPAVAKTEPVIVPVIEPVAQPAPRAMPVKAAKVANSEPTAVEKASLKPAKPGKQATADSLHSVRAAIASLGDVAGDTTSSLSSSQVLKMLEVPSGGSAEATAASPEAPPQATGYAVQLRFSVKPIPMSEVPQLAIFEAYTLYNAEGNREGRRWYGLRLGFFSDAASAKQVAHYVRSEFSEVSVVPVSDRERNRAIHKVEAAKQEQREHNRIAETVESTGMFRLIEELPQIEPSSGEGLSLVEDRARRASGEAGEAADEEESQAARPDARKPPMTLDETLEVLGANELKLAGNRKELLNATTARLIHHASHRKQPNRSKLAKLFDRLADRFGNL